MRSGDEVGPYRLESMLGEGATAEVWRAEHVSLKVPRALKFLTHASTEAHRRMLFEAQAQASLSHENVITVHDVFSHLGRPVIALDLVEGVTLDDWALVHHSDRSILAVVAQVLEGLQVMRDAGLVHRDLKPSNLMVDFRGVVKIADFGLARLGEGRGTRTGALMGTPAFMSPEQTDDATAANHRSDLFSVAVVAVFLLTDRSIFDRDTVRETLLAVHDCESHLAAVALERGVTPERDRLIDFIEATLRFDPEERPEDAGACLEILGRPSHTVSVPPPPSTSRPPQRSVWTDPVLATLGSVAGGGLMAAVLLVVGMLYVAGPRLSLFASASAYASVEGPSPDIEAVATGGTVGPPGRVELEVVHASPPKRRILGLFKIK